MTANAITMNGSQETSRMLSQRNALMLAPGVIPAYAGMTGRGESS